MPTPKRRRFEIRQRQNRRSKRKTVIHGITGIGIEYGRGITGEPFHDLQKLLKKGFVGTDQRYANAITVLPDSKSSGITTWSKQSGLSETDGDRYGVRMLTKVKKWESEYGINRHQRPLSPGEEVFVGFAHPGQVKVVYVQINPELSKLERQARIEFYRKTFPKQRIEFS